MLDFYPTETHKKLVYKTNLIDLKQIIHWKKQLPKNLKWQMQEPQKSKIHPKSIKQLILGDM